TSTPRAWTDSTCESTWSRRVTSPCRSSAAAATHALSSVTGEPARPGSALCCQRRKLHFVDLDTPDREMKGPLGMPDRTGLPFGDTADFEAADRGLIDAGDPVVRNEAGQVIWDNGSYGFLTGEAPDTVHPSMWRQSTMVARQGLFEVTDGIYQVRGYDLSNMSVIEGDTGIIVIDPLISTETAAAALALYRKHRGDRPVVAVIHTHSHVDHFGGVKGVVSQADVDAGRVQIIAPDGFVEHAI